MRRMSLWSVPARWKRDDPGRGKGAGEDKEGLSYVASDHHIDAPHWDASYPWTEDPASLPINREAVMATFLRTEKCLLKQPEWRTAYGEQVHEMSCAPAVRTGEHAALGDITKMYNSVWLKDRERHLHRFLWRDNPEEDIGSTPSRGEHWRPSSWLHCSTGNEETAGLPQFIEREEERCVLEKDSYVDDILTSHDDLEMLDTITSGVEEILSAGGFSLKPWVRPAKVGGERTTPEPVEERPEATPKTLVLPNQLEDEDNKALGIGYLVDSDQLYMMTSVNFKRKGRMRTGLNLKIEEVRENTPKGLSRRELLSQVAALYDPIGLVSPAKQKGNILVRRAFQEAGGGSSAKETWDDPISPGLREEAIKLFGEYVRLGEVKFHRSLTPSGQRGRPWGITFSDGSDHAYGAVLYVRWETQQGIEVRLVESKAKLAPLDQKGDAVRAEVCGAVYATRLRKYVERHSRLQIEHWIHLVDSRTVLGAIQRELWLPVIFCKQNRRDSEGRVTNRVVVDPR
ncbi:hypothetical protein AAFF_G00407340 [Aldrovandia affinis]|uniref:Uncharacterized protein n=1 Tax=Aldrovandia affinis TaxID=143900 RepID=A0AAD7R3S0_9TELE|nr:hypothetical protein AAFF_G00407340 [Aldrovandia affinis]